MSFYAFLRDESFAEHIHEYALKIAVSTPRRQGNRLQAPWLQTIIYVATGYAAKDLAVYVVDGEVR